MAVGRGEEELADTEEATLSLVLVLDSSLDYFNMQFNICFG